MPRKPKVTSGKKKLVGFSLHPDVKARVLRLAKKEGRSFANMCERLINTALQFQIFSEETQQKMWGEAAPVKALESANFSEQPTDS